MNRPRRGTDLIVEVIPRIVAIAPGPHISGIASGTKAIFAPFAADATIPPDAGGEKSSKPIFTRMMPPTMRTMASGTPNRRRINVPNIRKKRLSNKA